MARSPYQVPDDFLVEQGYVTSVELGLVTPRSAADLYALAGLDVTVHQRAVTATFEAAWAAQPRHLLAWAWHGVAVERGQEAAERAYRWEGWLRRTVEDATLSGLRVSVQLAQQDPPRLVGMIGRLRRVMPDVARERAVLATRVAPALLDEGAAHLAELEALDARVRQTEAVLEDASKHKARCRAALIAAFRAHDRAVGQVVARFRSANNGACCGRAGRSAFFAVAVRPPQC